MTAKIVCPIPSVQLRSSLRLEDNPSDGMHLPDGRDVIPQVPRAWPPTGHVAHIEEQRPFDFDRRSYWIPGSYAPVLSEKRNSFFNDY